MYEKIGEKNGICSQQSIKSAESQLTEEQKKLKNKAKIKWLVKVEYHV